jgi:hypothetical protein
LFQGRDPCSSARGFLSHCLSIRSFSSRSPTLGFLSLLSFAGMAVVDRTLAVKLFAQLLNQDVSVRPIRHLATVGRRPGCSDCRLEVVMKARAIAKSLGQFVRRDTGQPWHPRSKAFRTERCDDNVSVGYARPTIAKIH